MSTTFPSPSKRRNRVYERKFDWDEALRLRDEEGMTLKEIAHRFGVTDGAIDNALQTLRDPTYAERKLTYHREWSRENQRGPCRGCGEVLVWTNVPGRAGLCPRCTGAERAKDGVRVDELLCRKCGEWKDDDAFRLRPGEQYARRGRGPHCRSCENRARQAYRERTKEPCIHCGTLAYKPSEKKRSRGRPSSDVPRCRPCFQALQGGRLDERLAGLHLQPEGNR